ncbi:hypothetical protein ACNGB2_00695 [Campylobacter coli]
MKDKVIVVITIADSLKPDSIVMIDKKYLLRELNILGIKINESIEKEITDNVLSKEHYHMYFECDDFYGISIVC